MFLENNYEKFPSVALLIHIMYNMEASPQKDLTSSIKVT